MNAEEFDRNIKGLFSEPPGHGDEGKHERVLEEVCRMYQVQTKRAKYLTWGYLAAITVAILLCFLKFAETDNVKTMLGMVLIILILHEGTVLMKLWWWVYSSRNATLETLKAVQIQLDRMESAMKARGQEGDANRRPRDRIED